MNRIFNNYQRNKEERQRIGEMEADGHKRKDLKEFKSCCVHVVF